MTTCHKICHISLDQELQALKNKHITEMKVRNCETKQQLLRKETNRSFTCCYENTSSV